MEGRGYTPPEAQGFKIESVDDIPVTSNEREYWEDQIAMNGYQPELINVYTRSGAVQRPSEDEVKKKWNTQTLS